MSYMVTIRISTGSITHPCEIKFVYQKTPRCLFSAAGSPILGIGYYRHQGRRTKELVT